MTRPRHVRATLIADVLPRLLLGLFMVVGGLCLLIGLA